jgi:hypothetical protein
LDFVTDDVFDTVRWQPMPILYVLSVFDQT